MAYGLFAAKQALDAYFSPGRNAITYLQIVGLGRAVMTTMLLLSVPALALIPMIRLPQGAVQE